MARSYIKTSHPSALRTPDDIEATVQAMVATIRDGGEDEAARFASRLDGWDGPAVVDRSTIDAAHAGLAPSLGDDIREAHRHIETFAIAQRDSLQPFEIEVAPGLRAGHRLVPMNVVGCYVPAGRFAHIASALMSVTTSVTAGVGTTIVASPARQARGGVHPAILVAADIAGADVVLGLGGVQAIASLAFGLFTGQPADIIVGPGNSYVAEAKRQFFGEVGIDLVAGPTESMIVADKTTDPHRVAVDLVGQAEHGADSPVWLAAGFVGHFSESWPCPGNTSDHTMCSGTAAGEWHKRSLESNDKQQIALAYSAGQFGLRSVAGEPRPRQPQSDRPM